MESRRIQVFNFIRLFQSVKDFLMLGTKREKKVDETSNMAVSRIGAVGEVSMKRLKIQVDAIIMILIKAEWKPNAVPLKY